MEPWKRTWRNDVEPLLSLEGLEIFKSVLEGNASHLLIDMVDWLYSLHPDIWRALLVEVKESINTRRGQDDSNST